MNRVSFRVIGDFAPQGLCNAFFEKYVCADFLASLREKIVESKRETQEDSDGSKQNEQSLEITIENGVNEVLQNGEFIPLVLCDNRETLKQRGIFCPYEFVIERKDLLPSVNADGAFTSDPSEIMASRLSVLALLYGGCPFINSIRDWFAGAFRIYMMLDATTHGTSEFVDLEQVKEGTDPILLALAQFSSEEIERRHFKGDCRENDKAIREETINNAIKHARRIRNRFIEENEETSSVQTASSSAQNDPLLRFKQLAKSIFSDYFETWGNSEPKLEDVGRSMVRALGLGTPEKRFEALCAIYYDGERQAIASNDQCGRIIHVKGGSDFCITTRNHKERLPVAFGDRAKHVTLTGKLNLLLIDDNVKASPLSNIAVKNVPTEFSSIISQDDWDLLREIFNVQTMPVDQKDGDIYRTAVQRFRDFHKKGLTFDLILVDLCLGNNRQGSDLAGYAMIRIARVFFPGTPIVVYSRFSDMEHIARAFFSGAKWFLVKGEEAKLPRHVLKLLKQIGWHREWRTVKNSFHAPEFVYEKNEDDFSRRFDRTEEWKYLTYKSLEYFPGKFITIKRMGGGISSAVTFKATKGVKLGGDFLQTPCIIKIDTSYNTMMEFGRYFRMIRPYIANECGRVEMPERVLNRTYSSIVYTFAGKQDKAHTLESMGDMLDDNVACQTACDYETYRYALQCIFDEILPKIHRVSPELEFADIGKSSVLSSEVMDAFKWKDRPERKSSFPNFYFSEFEPSEFWKSYMLRMQPWGRIPIDFKAAWPFKIQETPDAKKRLIFHNVMTEPFARIGDKKAGKRIIEAYTDDRRLVWLEGDACDFVARFRKRVSPGTSLWLDDTTYGQIDKIDSIPKIERAAESCQDQSKAVELSRTNGRLCWLNDTFKYKSKGCKDAKTSFVSAIAVLLGIRLDSDKEKVELQNDGELGFYIKLQDAVLDIARKASAMADEWSMRSPVGIIHGDLNVKNIMLESRKHPPREDDPDVTKKVSDVWLIDFARTRRDLIVHDFNVFFTSVLGELFTEGLIGKEGTEKSAHQDIYWGKLISNFRVIVSDAVDPESKNEKGIPDELKDDRRFKLIYRILRRTHDAALTAGVSQNMYLLTTALACLYTLKIFLNNGCKVRLAAGYFAAAWICYDLLCENIGEENQMEGFKKPADNGTISSKARMKHGKHDANRKSVDVSKKQLGDTRKTSRKNKTTEK